jgi:hypothetical protein
MMGAAAKRVVYLSPSFAPYRVPVFDSLYAAVGEGFTVVTLHHPHLEIGRVALRMGSFPRLRMRAVVVNLSRTHDQGLRAPLSFLYPPSLPWQLRLLKPEVVISNNLGPWTFTSVLMGYPTVVFWEGTHHTERTVGSWHSRLRRWIAQRADAFVVNGILSRRYLQDMMGVAANRVIEGGLCPAPLPNHVQRGPRTLLPGAPLRCLFMGEMIGRKGVVHLLHAAAALGRRLGKEGRFEIALVGNGAELPRYQGLARELGIQERVHFDGFIAPDQVWGYYERAHVFVLPTLQDNWPLVVPEAMSTGLPVLLSQRAGSLPDLIREGENGYSFDPEDHEGLADRLESYIRNPGLVTEHGKRSLELVSRYTPERTAEAFLQAIGAAKNNHASRSL